MVPQLTGSLPVRLRLLSTVWLLPPTPLLQAEVQQNHHLMLTTVIARNHQSSNNQYPQSLIDKTVPSRLQLNIFNRGRVDYWLHSGWPTSIRSNNPNKLRHRNWENVFLHYNVSELRLLYHINNYAEAIVR